MLNNIFGSNLIDSKVVKGLLKSGNSSVEVTFTLDVSDNGRTKLWMSPFVLFNGDGVVIPAFSTVMEVLSSPEPHKRGAGHCSEENFMPSPARWNIEDSEKDLYDELSEIWNDSGLIDWKSLRSDGSSEYRQAHIFAGDYVWQRVMETNRSLLGKVHLLKATIEVAGVESNFSAWYLKRIVARQGTNKKRSPAGECQYAFWGFDLLDLPI